MRSSNHLLMQGWTNNIPSAAPKNGLPPNLRVAEKPSNTGKNTNGAFAMVLMKSTKSARPGCISITLNSSTKKPFAVSMEWIPLTNRLRRLLEWLARKYPLSLSPNVAISFDCLTPLLPLRLLLTSPIPNNLVSSAWTLFTVPEPKIIWYWPATANCPSRLQCYQCLLCPLCFHRLAIRKRVAQCAAVAMFFFATKLINHLLGRFEGSS